MLSPRENASHAKLAAPRSAIATSSNDRAILLIGSNGRWTVKLRFGYVSRNLTMPPVKPMVRLSFAAIAAAALLYGCASSPKATDQTTSAASPLAGMAGRQMLVFPAQYLAVMNPGGGWDIVPGGPGLLPILDEEIADTFRKRG